jgi:hypothetical protein
MFKTTCNRLKILSQWGSLIGYVGKRRGIERQGLLPYGTNISGLRTMPQQVR